MNDSPGILREVIGHAVVTLLYFKVQIRFAHALEGEVAGKHNIQEDAKRPHVDSSPIILPLLSDLWGHIRWGATENLQLLSVRAEDREAKVDDLDYVSLLLYQDVV